MKISNDKALVATLYTNDANTNKRRTPTATPENPLVEVFLPLTVMLLGALGRPANGGCTSYNIWKAARKMAGEASAGVNKRGFEFMVSYDRCKCNNNNQHRLHHTVLSTL